MVTAAWQRQGLLPKGTTEKIVSLQIRKGVTDVPEASAA